MLLNNFDNKMVRAIFWRFFCQFFGNFWRFFGDFWMIFGRFLGDSFHQLTWSPWSVLRKKDKSSIRRQVNLEKGSSPQASDFNFELRRARTK
jgi:hypothetical protein